MRLIDFGEQRIIIGSVLVQRVVPDDHHLDLLHVELLVHLNGALVNHVNQVFLLNLFEHSLGMLLTLKENIAAVFSADNDYAEVHRVEVGVNVENVGLSYARDADGSPGLSVLHGGVGEDVVEDHSDISYKSELKYWNLAYLALSSHSPAGDQ